MEILWNDNPKTNFLDDLKSFAMSLDNYQISFNIEKSDESKYLSINNGEYDISCNQKSESFKCPVCKGTKFQIMEGEFQEKPVLGLACLKCETYGAAFPNGL
ncbi:MAG: hypothetical protein WA584_18550 [Pyrinomonadaceae bacterium]